MQKSPATLQEISAYDGVVLGSEPAAIGRDYRAIDEAGFIRNQEERQLSDISRLQFSKGLSRKRPGAAYIYNLMESCFGVSFSFVIRLIHRMKKQNLYNIPSRKTKQFLKTYLDTEPPLEKNLPTGPFKTVTGKSQADLLLFVPRNEIGRTIDDLTGRYGYSHLAIDCGEIDVPTGRRVMIESTVAPGVHYAFLEEYGDRPFARLPLQNTGMDVQQFCRCVHSKVGDHFDNLKVITLGILDNPARQICSDLATVCLPNEMCERIIRCHDGTVLHPLSIARHEMPGFKTRLFISPNGYAEFFGAPRGKSIHGVDQLVEPHMQESSREELIPKMWKLGDAAMISAWKVIKNRAVEI